MQDKVLQQDISATLNNRKALFRKPNLLYWYHQLYEKLLGDPQSTARRRILEIGSGMSPLKHFYPSVLTSDIMPMGHIDYIFDAHWIDHVQEIAPLSLDVITLTNVLHHLQDPISFLLKAREKLCTGGRIILVEPYYSRLSKLIYTKLHHEASDFSVKAPLLSNISGPLSSANMAIPFLIFFGNKGWDKTLRPFYHWPESELFYFTALSYMVAGGVARNFFIPHFCYKMFFKIDSTLANKYPFQFASFFCLTLIKR